MCVRAFVYAWVGGWRVMHWPIARGVTTLDAPTRNVQNIKDKHPDQPAKKTCDAVPHPHVASVEPLLLEATHFQKYRYMQDVLCSVTEHLM